MSEAVDIGAESTEAPQAKGRLLFSALTFEQLGVDADLREGLLGMGFSHATLVQQACFAPVIAGKDVVVQAKTGSGKTAAFGVPMFQRMQRHKEDPRPRGLVLCPTRELASQVEHELAQIGRQRGMVTVAIYGGVGFDKQNSALRSGVDVVVGTPGRIMDQIEKKNLSLDAVQTLVLDEADEMLSMGFWDDVLWLTKRLPKDRQTLLFSATLPLTIERAARQFQRDPVRVDLSTDAVASESVTHYAYASDERIPKPRNLLYIMEVEHPTSAIIFCNRRSDVALIGSVLANQGYEAEVLSGDLTQSQRERVMNAIKEHRLRFMVATDIAARGIDISALSHVFNYSLPEDPEVYVHRAGRTGRIGNTGVCVSLIGGAEEQTKTVLKRDFGVQFHEKQLPDLTEVERMRSERIMKELLEKAAQAEVTQHLPAAAAVLASGEGQVIVAFLIKQYLSRANRPSLLEGGATTANAPAVAPLASKPARTMPAAAPPPPRPKAVDAPQEEGEVNGQPEGQPKIYVSLGEIDGVDTSGARALLTEWSGLSDADLGQLELRRTNSYVRLDKTHAEKLLALHGRPFKDRQLVVERARRRRR